MTVLREVYKCEICGNMAEMVHTGGGQMSCCGRLMKLMKENSVDAANEKHVPVIEKIQGGVKVKVGEVEHPMMDKHYIEWIEVHTENKVYRKFLNPGEKPEAVFMVEEEVLYARGFCNLHGLWKSEKTN
ncbi:desulfoferrodoxin [Clostridium sp. ZS2-4]|uniref:desulfoferrodoxin n=1 Tax=Clostridium sp. ZS2-4 TaxID=2987703 RepID=UPI00227C94A1|nr:desulfoferrodoxin [Clostridium sp. ZS2-4]MCY6356797.1 desulfoferrodoxin [Clostridium sp. ZS2-4]